ncbi:tyrosine-type recombinase/integrase [Oryzobacter sp. R7]|uniref:tyrosine-type recombinase/integrase n=1 Tax=Oryzobacter faecalis TaxID=3388656 RepID=UPI00398CEADC
MSSGRFQARYYGPDLQYHSAPNTFDTKGDATAWLMTERALISQQRWTPPKVRDAESRRAVERRQAQVFAVYAEQWLEGRVTTRGKALRPSTVAGYRNALDVHILPAFGTLSLDEINSAVVRHWRGQFAVRGNDSAGAKAYSVLKAILQTAEDDELITRNPCRLKGGGSAAKVRESVALSPVELAALVDAMPDHWRALTLASGWCGLRIGEAAGLRIGDVDLTTGALHIRQTAQYVGHPARLVLGPPKSERGIRIVHMPDHVTEALGTYLGTKAGTNPKDFVWTRSDGQPISRHTTLKAFQTATASIGRAGMVWHDLRHTANTLAADAGATQATLQARMGHADPKVSALYLHTSQARDQALAAALSRMADTSSGRRR